MTALDTGQVGAVHTELRFRAQLQCGKLDLALCPDAIRVVIDAEAQVCCQCVFFLYSKLLEQSCAIGCNCKAASVLPMCSTNHGLESISELFVLAHILLLLLLQPLLQSQNLIHA